MFHWAPTSTSPPSTSSSTGENIDRLPSKPAPFPTIRGQRCLCGSGDGFLDLTVIDLCIQDNRDLDVCLQNVRVPDEAKGHANNKSVPVKQETSLFLDMSVSVQ